jgi:hypothetical protein
MAKRNDAPGDDAAAGAPVAAAPRRIGMSTVARPCLIGAVVLTLLHSALVH